MVIAPYRNITQHRLPDIHTLVGWGVPYIPSSVNRKPTQTPDPYAPKDLNPKACRVSKRRNWVLVKGFHLSYQNKEAIVFTRDPYYGNLKLKSLTKNMIKKPFLFTRDPCYGNLKLNSLQSAQLNPKALNLSVEVLKTRVGLEDSSHKACSAAA